MFYKTIDNFRSYKRLEFLPEFVFASNGGGVEMLITLRLINAYPHELDFAANPDMPVKAGYVIHRNNHTYWVQKSMFDAALFNAHDKVVLSISGLPPGDYTIRFNHTIGWFPTVQQRQLFRFRI